MSDHCHGHVLREYTLPVYTAGGVLTAIRAQRNPSVVGLATTIQTQVYLFGEGVS